MSDIVPLDNNGDSLDGLRNLKKIPSPDGVSIVEIPETRLSSAFEAQALVRRAVLADQVRDGKRAKVQGLVDGNPPYRQGDLTDANRADACNVNWGTARSNLNTAKDAFYDIFNEAETYAVVSLDLPDIERESASRIVTEEFDRLQKRDRAFDSVMQVSQREMVLFGAGPQMFEDATDWRTRPVLYRNLLVPEDQKSDTHEWEWAAIRTDYLPHRLYEFILDEAAAERIGWDCEAVKNAIIHAHPATRQGGNYLNWEWHQQQIKNSSFYYSAQAKKIFAAHVFFKEFPKAGEVSGCISHVIVLELYGETSESGEPQFLFQSIGRYKDWTECVHALYFDIGSGGDHHAVEGIGVKMYSAMEFQNRLLCNLADKAFAPKMMFKPTTPNGEALLEIATMGEYGAVPSGWDAVQMPVQPLMNDGLLINREMKDLMAANLSQYRQDVQDDQGNPITAHEAQIRASEQSRLGNTQLNRYYNQLDFLYAEKYRRATNPNLHENMPGAREAIEFQRRCERRGVRVIDLQKVDSVIASRVTGQGSQFMRQQQLDKMISRLPLLPEDGRDNVIRDFIASAFGQHFVKRYYPSAPAMQKPTEQMERATNQVGDMKLGISPPMVDTQNPVIFAQTFLQAGSAALQSLQQGANPVSLLPFLELVGQGVAAHLARFQNDPTRNDAYKVLNEQFKKYGQLVDQLKGQVQAQMAKMQKQAQQNGANGGAQNGNGQGAKESIAINYKDAPADIQRQMEAVAGFKPSKQPDTSEGAPEPPGPQETAAAAGHVTRTRLDVLKTAQEMRHREESHQQTLEVQRAESAAKIKNMETAAQAKAQAAREPKTVTE